jgi:adenylate kinase
LGLEAKGFMDRGALVPDEVVIGMIRERLTSGAQDAFLLDGFPRTLAQAEALDGMLAGLGAPLDAVLSLEVPPDELRRRLEGRWLCRRCGNSYHETSRPYVPGTPCERGGGDCEIYQRADDQPEAIAARLAVYEADTAPLIGYYRDHGILRTVDGTRSADDVATRISAALS